jgi:MFS family permease
VSAPQDTPAVDGWRTLVGPRFLGTSILLAGGVALYATNEFVTVSLLPSAIADIGGERLYAWVTTLYLVGAVVAATSVNALLLRIGPRVSFLLGLIVFGIGSVVCALAPSMEVLLVGRTLQGTAGGLLAGLGYALINTALPRSLWTRASALASAMWGVATVIGPTAGGLFAQFGLWRWAFGVMAILALPMVVLVPRVLPARIDSGEAAPTLQVPVWSIVLLGTAALTISLAQIPTNVGLTAGLLAISLALVGAFIIVDRRMAVKVLPTSVFGSGPLKWIYLALAVLMASAMVDMYVPLFGQRLAHLVPVAAGLLGAALAVGWAVSEVLSASLSSKKFINRVVVFAPLAIALGLGLAAATQVDNAPAGIVVTWALALTITGIGIGAAWPHLSAWSMQSIDDEAEGSAAAAAINTIEVIAGAFGAGLAGVVVNTAEGSMVLAARALYVVFAVVGLLGAWVAYRATRGLR